jgi:hypothetical protein
MEDWSIAAKTKKANLFSRIYGSVSVSFKPLNLR